MAADLVQKRRELNPPLMPLAQLNSILARRRVSESARAALVQMLYLYGVVAEEKAGDRGLIIDPVWECIMDIFLSVFGGFLNVYTSELCTC